MLELLLRNEPTRHALLGFENEPFAILVIRGVRLPRLMMPLFALPFDVAAVDGNEDLEFTALVLVPPTEFDAHAFPRKDELPSAFGERKFSDNGIGAKFAVVLLDAPDAQAIGQHVYGISAERCGERTSVDDDRAALNSTDRRAVGVTEDHILYP